MYIHTHTYVMYIHIYISMNVYVSEQQQESVTRACESISLSLSLSLLLGKQQKQHGDHTGWPHPTFGHLLNRLIAWYSSRVKTQQAPIALRSGG